MRGSPQNRPRGEFQGQRNNNHREGRGRRHHRHPDGERQGPPRQRKRNRKRNQQADLRHRENRPPRRRNRQRSPQHPMREHFPHHNRMREGFDREAPFRRRRRDGFRPAAGFIFYDDRVEIEVELPGVEEKDITVSVEGKMLSVKGKKQRKQSDEKHNFGRSELKYGRFHRAFPLLPIAKADGIKANYKDGILSIVIPKKEEAKPKEIPINTDS